jgi:hypothetical protein
VLGFFLTVFQILLCSRARKFSRQLRPRHLQLQSWVIIGEATGGLRHQADPPATPAHASNRVTTGIPKHLPPKKPTTKAPAPTTSPYILRHVRHLTLLSDYYR